jgi:hypothetical protein
MKKTCYHAIFLAILIASSLAIVETVDFAAAVQIHLSAKAAKASVTAGASLSFNVSAMDSLNNIVSTYSGSVAFSSSDPNAVLPSKLNLKAGTSTVTVTFKTAGVQTLTLTDTVDSTVNGAASVTVNPGAAQSFEVVVSSSIGVGKLLPVSVTAHDNCGNVVTSYRGTVEFSSSDPKASLPVSGAMTSGRGLFSATFNTPGTQAVTVSDSVNHGVSGTSNQIVVGYGETESPTSAATSMPTAEPTVTPAETPIQTPAATPTTTTTPTPNQEENKNAQALPLEAIVGIVVVVAVVVTVAGMLAMRKRRKE